METWMQVGLLGAALFAAIEPGIVSKVTNMISPKQDDVVDKYEGNPAYPTSFFGKRPSVVLRSIPYAGKTKYYFEDAQTGEEWDKEIADEDLYVVDIPASTTNPAYTVVMDLSELRDPVIQRERKSRQIAEEQLRVVNTELDSIISENKRLSASDKERMMELAKMLQNISKASGTSVMPIGRSSFGSYIPPMPSGDSV